MLCMTLGSKFNYMSGSSGKIRLPLKSSGSVSFAKVYAFAIFTIFQSLDQQSKSPIIYIDHFA